MGIFSKDPIEDAVAEAMVEHGPDGHIDGYAEIAKAAINAHFRLTPDEWKTKREEVARAIYSSTGSPLHFEAVGKPQRQEYRKRADVAMTALGFTRT